MPHTAHTIVPLLARRYLTTLLVNSANTARLFARFSPLSLCRAEGFHLSPSIAAGQGHCLEGVAVLSDELVELARLARDDARASLVLGVIGEGEDCETDLDAHRSARLLLAVVVAMGGPLRVVVVLRSLCDVS